MSGSIFGKNFTVSTWGESHGKAVGVCVDGCPAGIKVDEEYIQSQLDRRKPGTSEFVTKRNEKDKVHILSGVFEGVSTGSPILMMINNEDQHSKDYNNIKDIYRPGHADFSFDSKYGVGIRDYRGGGRSSGRETIGRVAAGALAGLILDQLGVSVNAYTKQIGNIEIDYDKFDLDFAKNSALCMPDKDASEKAADYVRELMVEKDSSGGTIECVVDGLKAGFGEPVFDKLDANLAKAIFSIGAVKGFEIGDGFKVAESRGSENNDEFISENGNVTKSTNHSGGILGGISDGSQIVFRAAFKPTPSIAREQKTVDNSGNETEIEIHGRHDPLIVPRAVVVAESMAKLVIVDEIMDGMRSRVSFIKEFYERL